MKKRTILKVIGAVVAVAGILGIAAYVSNKKEEKERLDDDNEYIKTYATTKVSTQRGLYTRYIKRGLDVVLSASGLVILLPAFVIISAIIYIDDPGPVIFKQKRVGKDCKFFYCHKFRSMKMSTPHDVPTHQITDPDQYITKVGRVLRRTSLDEIPQCWDIFRSKMAVIGPRPALWNQDDLVAERAKYGANDVIPGLTGLAQISGRDELEITDKARIDGEYVKKQGFLTDVKCFFETIKSVLQHDGVVEGGTGSFPDSSDYFQKVRTKGLQPVRAEDVGFENYGHKKVFSIDKSRHVSVLIAGADSYIGESFRSYCEKHYPNISINTLDMRKPEWRCYPFQTDSGRLFDTVFHVAGIAHADVGKASAAEQVRYYEINCDLAVECAEKSRDAGIHQFIFMSSMIIYGGAEKIDEFTLPSPANFYGDSKWQGDKGVRALAEPRRYEVAVLRPPMIYGKGSKGNYPQLSKIAKYTPIFPKVDNTRSMLYIENLCEFVAQLILSGEGGIYFPQNAEYSNTSELVATIGTAVGSRIHISRILSPAVLLSKKVSIGKVRRLAEKAFRSSYYDQGLSQYEGLDYQKIDLEESIKRTED